MQIRNITEFQAGTCFEADVIVIGGGPAGITVAREFAGTSTRVLVLESGVLQETLDHAALAEVESVGEPRTDIQKQKRRTSHGSISPFWSAELQPFGVRCRALGGSTHAWMGKSAPFDLIDFDERPWVANSGWPLSLQDLSSYLRRAAEVLNLGPLISDDELWNLIGVRSPTPWLSREDFRSFFWQFARSRLDPLDIMRFGSEFATLKADNIRVLLNATVTHIGLTGDGASFDHVNISGILGERFQARAKRSVVAASAIENARLLLASNDIQSRGIGNGYDLVGRYLMDHAVSRVGHFNTSDVAAIIKAFGFYGLNSDGRTNVYMHGLAPSPDMQERNGLLNAAVYFMPERSLDDPFDALKRIMRRRSTDPISDASKIALGINLIIKGIAMKAFSSSAMPQALKQVVTDFVIRRFPNFAVEEFQSRGLPHKLSGASMEIISEQRPDENSRVSLSERKDRLGVPLPKVDWRINDDERNTIVRVAHLTCAALGRAGLPMPVLEPWIERREIQNGNIIDFAHSLGTTRMSKDYRSGVVDTNSQVHGVNGLYVAGGSTFPTSGHANPTLMIVALAIRVADRIKLDMSRSDILSLSDTSSRSAAGS